MSVVEADELHSNNNKFSLFHNSHVADHFGNDLYSVGTQETLCIHN